MAPYIVALLIGIIAGLRTFTAPTAVAWAAHVGWLSLQETPFAFLGTSAATYIFTALAIAELVTDKLPKTPSRKVPVSFAARLISGAFCGAAIGVAGGSLAGGLIVGLVGTVIGTLGGHAARIRLGIALGKDLPAALIEDLVAVGGAVLIMVAAR